MFLSSTFKEFAHDGTPRPIQLREEIIGAAWPVDIWAYEQRYGVSPEAAGPEIVDRCIDGVLQSDAFVFLLTGRHGSGVDLGAARATVSYLEAELFFAAVAGKPIFVLRRANAALEPALENLLRILAFAFPAQSFYVGDDRRLTRAFREIAARLAFRASTGGRLLGLLVDQFSLARCRRNGVADLVDPQLAFLDGWIGDARGAEGDLALAGEALDRAASGRDEQGTPLAYPARLSRIWIAMRELGQFGAEGRTLPRVAGLWRQAYGLWSSAASWVGLHGHLQMSPLAALNSDHLLHAQERAGAPDSPDLREPVGARASALYSIAQRAQRRKFFHFKQVVRLTTDALETEGNVNLLAIRGAALLRMMRAGHFARGFEARADFARLLSSKEKANADPASIGETLVDLGLAQVLTGRGGRGYAALKKGVDLMVADPGARSRAGFIARAYRKQASAASILLRFGEAAEARKNANEWARASGALDQLNRED